MGGRDDLVKALGAIVSSARSEPDESPTADELLAYRDGVLEPAERARIAAKLERFPEAALALENLESFPEVRSPVGSEGPTEAETEAAWEAFRRRMGYAEGSAPGPSRDEQEESAVTRAPAGRRSRWWSRPAWAWGFAVVLLAIGLALGWAAGRSHPRPTSSLVVAQLVPEGSVRPRAGSQVERLRIAKGTQAVVLVLGGAGEAAGSVGPVRVERADGELVWSASTVEVDSTGTGWLQLPVAYLSAGGFRVVVEKGSAGGGTVARTYRFEVGVESAL